ncbi:MAG: hypothetical protein H8E18_10785 [FCB group bacterium]|nr:hypothetical protein [FCB group bacterium]
MIPTLLFSKNGYKEFEWEMSVEEISSLVNDLTKEEQLFTFFTAPRNAFFYKYADEIVSSIPNPLSFVESDIISYDSESRNLKFYFLENKLLGIKVSFLNKSIIRTMTDKYGMVNPVRGSSLMGDYRTASWFNLSGRIIVWEDYATGMEYVYYFDKAWFTAIQKLTIEEFRRKKRESNSLLD